MEDINNNLSEQEQTQEQSQESENINKNFGELSNSEQTEIIQKSFYGEDEEKQEQEQEQDNNASEKTGDKQEQEKNPEPEQEQTQESEFYTTEEFLLEDPLKVNRDKLPEAAKLVHDKYMQFFNNQILPQLQELQNLKANKNINSSQDNNSQQDKLKQEQENFNNLVKQEAAKRLNLKSIDELDDFNSEHNIMLARIATQFEQIQHNQQSQQAYYQNNYNRAMQDLTQEFGSQEFAKIDAFALKDLEKLPFDLHQKVLSDLQTGDAETIKNIFRAFAERYKIANKKTSINQTPKEPPKVIAGSGNDSNIKRSWGIKDFSRGSGIDKARMLIDGGFLDD